MNSGDWDVTRLEKREEVIVSPWIEMSSAEEISETMHEISDNLWFL